MAFTAPQAFGPRVQTLATYLHEVHHVPYGRLETMLGEVFGLEMAAGSLVNLVRRTGMALEEQAEAISLEVIQSAVIGSDETSARVEGRNQWQWVFRTPQASYYVIVPSRGAQVIREVLGQARPQVWLSDLWSAQQKAPAEQFQLCHSHQLQDLEYAKECGDTLFAPAMQDLLRRSQALAKQRAELPPEEFQRPQASHLHRVRSTAGRRYGAFGRFQVAKAISAAPGEVVRLPGAARCAL